MKDLKNKVVVITGTASGLGKALTIGLYDNRSHLALPLDKTAKRIINQI